MASVQVRSALNTLASNLSGPKDKVADRLEMKLLARNVLELGPRYHGVKATGFLGTAPTAR